MKNADFEWYLSKSREINGPHRCPFAAANRCPRYYESIYLLGEVGIATKVSPENKTKLDALWKDFEATIGEEAASISGGESNSTMAMSNFCPEVSYKIFGLFASGLFPFHGDTDRDMADSRLRRAGIKASDPRWHWAKFTPAHYSECSEYSILQARVTTEKRESATGGTVFNIENVQGAVGHLVNSQVKVVHVDEKNNPNAQACEYGVTVRAVFHQPSSIALEVVNIGREKIIINKMEATFRDGKIETKPPQLAKLDTGNIVLQPISLSQRGDIDYAERIETIFHELPIKLDFIDTLGTRYPVEALEKAITELKEYPLSPKRIADDLRLAVSPAFVGGNSPAISEWCNAFLGIVTPLKIEMMRAQIPSDWYGRFDTAIPILSRLTSSIPADFDPSKRQQIVSLVDQTARLTDTQAVGNKGEIIKVLERLEVLSNDT